MCGRRTRYCLLVVFCSLTGFCSPGDDPEHLLRQITRSTCMISLPAALVRIQAWQDMDYSLSADFSSLFGHGSKTGKDIYIRHFLKYQFSLFRDSLVTVTAGLTHDFGLHCLPDSILQISPDETVISLSASVLLRRTYRMVLHSDLNTRLTETTEWVTDANGGLLKVAGASFLTPAVLVSSFGISRFLPWLGEISLGVSSFKLIWLRDTHVFDRLNTQVFSGIKKGKNHVFEYGVSLRILADRDLFRRLHWNFDLLVFSSGLSPFELTLKNVISINFRKYIRAGIQTRVSLDESSGNRFRVENQVRVGFSMHL